MKIFKKQLTDEQWVNVFERIGELQDKFPVLGIRIMFRPDGSGYIYGTNELTNIPLFNFADFEGLIKVTTEPVFSDGVQMFEKSMGKS